jgi:hypothetical protein
MKPLSLLLASLMALAGASLAFDTVSAKPTTESARGPGAQTEDELYIGAKGKTPQKAKTEQKTRAKPSSRGRGGDDDLDDLEVQRVRRGIKSNAR